ncbi:MAG: methyltransferase domain-containing protein [Candidatus Omnitrophota bacterium]
MKSSFCRVCKSPDLSKVMCYEKAPRNIERLLEPSQLSRDKAVELHVYQCKTCAHIQLLDQLEDEYYEEYLMSHSHAMKMKEFQLKQASNFLLHFNLKDAAVFESGCGDGQFSLILKDHGCRVLANEPSAKARTACEEKGLKTVGGYLGAGAFPTLRETFDAVVARQVLEHVPDPNDFVVGMGEILKPTGVGLIEVPSLEQAIENDRFFDFFPDHLSYFSSQALTHLFSRNGFQVVQIKRVMDGEYNEVWVKKTLRPNLENIQEAARNIAGAFRNFLGKEHMAGRKVAIWGAGAKGVLTLSMVDTGSVAYLIDLDPVKKDRYTPVSHLQVSSPDRLLREPVDTVIITALAYKDEIARDLRSRYAFKGKITYLAGGQIVADQV